jgi:hypothetical protein
MCSNVVHKTVGEKSDSWVDPVSVHTDYSVTEVSNVNSGDLYSHIAKNDPVMGISFAI